MIATRPSDVRRAVGLEWITLGWMTIEGAVALWAGIAAHSLSVTAFGIDSLIELVSAGVIMWRLLAEVRLGSELPSGVEHLAHRVAGALLVLLAAYVTVAAGISLYHHEGQQFTFLGAAVTTAAIAIMFPLARSKRIVAGRLDSRALRADAVESLACGYLSTAVLIGLVAQYYLQAWWIDGAVSLGIVYFLVREGIEAWGAADCC
jgi:divalent metal cation (Fe/Co/Zn/Cd) transporter